MVKTSDELNEGESRSGEPAVGEGAAGTIKTIPSRTLLTEHRLGALDVTFRFDRELLSGGVRRCVDASMETSERDARPKYLEAALEMTQAIEHTLRRRLAEFRSHVPESLRLLPKHIQSASSATWLARLDGTPQAKSSEFGGRKLAAALRDGQYPSLAVMGGWLREAWRLQPPELANDLQCVLGVPHGMEEYVYAAGETRNVLAHRVEYEGASRRHLGPASALLGREMVDGFMRIVIPERSTEILQWIAACVMERDARPFPLDCGLML